MEIVLDTMIVNVTNVGSDPSLSSGVLVGTDLEREHCPFCDTPNCNFDCDGSKAEFLEPDSSELPLQTEEEVLDRLKYNHALDVIESLALAICVQSRGVIDTIALKEILNPAIQTTLDKIGNQ